MTRNLFLFGLKHGHLLFKNKAGSVVRCPVHRLDGLLAGRCASEYALVYAP
jgi:hypothetical protein